MDKTESVFIGEKEASQILECSVSTVSRIFKIVNEMQKTKNKLVMRGKCNRLAFYDYIGK